MKEKNRYVLSGVLGVIIGLIVLAFGYFSGGAFIKLCDTEIPPGWFFYVFSAISLFVVFELIYWIACLNQKKGENWQELKKESFGFSVLLFCISWLVSFVLFGLIKGASLLFKEYLLVFFASLDLFEIIMIAILAILIPILIVFIVIEIIEGWKDSNKWLFDKFKKVKK